LGPERTATRSLLWGVGVRVLWAVIHRFPVWGPVVVCGWVVKCRVDASIFFLDFDRARPLACVVFVVCLMTV
jgi:hypothetical protein